MIRLAAVVATAFMAMLLSTGVAAAQTAPQSATAGSESADSSGDPCAVLLIWQKPACEMMKHSVQTGVGNIVSAGVTSVFDQLYQWVAGGASWLLGELVSLIDSSTRPNVTAGWFGEQYRLMGALAVTLVMPLLMISTLTSVVRQDWSGLGRSYFVYLPAAMIGTAVAIPLVDVSLGITDWMGSVFLDGMRGDITGFTDSVSSALATTAGVSPAGAGGVAPFLMFIGAAIIALGAFAVWVELVLRTAGIYVALFFLPLGFASLVWPSTRRWFGRLVKALAALILSKFVIVAVIALAAAALGNFTGPEGSGFGGVVAGSALMLMAAFSPLVLFRLADVAGDEMASAFAGVTQHRTSPVPTPSAQQSASKVYGRIMNGRVAKETGGLTPAVATSGASAAGGAAATGGAAAAAAGVAAALKAPKAAGEAAGERVAATAGSNGHAQPASSNRAGRGGVQGPTGRPDPAAPSSNAGNVNGQLLSDREPPQRSSTSRHATPAFDSPPSAGWSQEETR